MDECIAGLSNASPMLQRSHSRQVVAEPEQQHRGVPQLRPRHVEGLLGRGVSGAHRWEQAQGEDSHHLADATMSSIMGALVQLRPSVACLYAPYSCSRSLSLRAPEADLFTARCASANALRSAPSSACVGRTSPPQHHQDPDAVVSAQGFGLAGWWVHGDRCPSSAAALAKTLLLATRVNRGLQPIGRISSGAVDGDARA